MFETIIHRDDQVEAYNERGVPVAAFASQTPGADLYMRLADEVLARLSLNAN